MTRRTTAQALTEFAFVLPLFMMFVFATIQLSLIFVAYYSETRMARETSRWLAVNPTAVDTQVAQHVSDTMLPGLLKSSSNPPYNMDGTSTTTDAYYHVGNMDVKFTACNPTITNPNPAPPCLNTNRASGQTVYVEMRYNVANLVFLPTTFRFGWLTTTLPTTLPAYRISIMVE
jgi:Flp pilus assembly protein TadG